MGCSFPLLCSWANSAPIAWELVAKYSKRVFSRTGACRVGRWLMACWSFWKASYYSVSYMNSAPFFNSLDNPWVIEVRLGINLLIWETLPKKLLSSLTTIGIFMITMVVVLARSMLMHLWCTKKPRNLLEGNPKAHFSGFMHSLYILYRSKTCLRT